MTSNTLAKTNLTWGDLNFTQNCAAAADFNGKFFWGDRPEFLDTSHAIEDFIRSALPRGSAPPSRCEIMDWFERELREPNSNTTKRMYQDSFDHCRLQTCHQIEYPGNPDIAGIGMRAAYCMEAVMVTMYLAIFLIRAIQLRHRPKKSTPSEEVIPTRNSMAHKIGTRIKNAAEFTIGDFLNTAMVFNLSIVVAGLISIPTTKFKVYDMLQATLVTGFSLSVVLAIWPMQKEIKARQMLRNGFLAVNMFLSLAEISMIIAIQEAERNTTRKETLCLPQVFSSLSEPSPYFYLLQLLIGIAVFVSFWVLLYKLLVTKSTSEKIKKFPLVKLIGSIPWWWIVCLYGYVNLWLTLGGLFWVRYLVKTRISEAFEDSSWGFGQVMALATWLPNQADFIYFLIFGVQRGLRVRVNSPWNETYVDLEFEESEGGHEMEVVEESSESRLYHPQNHPHTFPI